MMPEDRLSDMQEKFCQNYILGMSQIDCALKAGYSAKTAHSIASTLLNNIKIKKRIAELKIPVSKELNITRERLAKNLLKIAEPEGDDIALTRKSDIIKATELLTKMFGLAEAEKQEVKITDMPDYKIIIDGTIKHD